MYMYQYSNGKNVKHTKLIKHKTILKESEGSATVKIFKIHKKLEDVAFSNQKEYVKRYNFVETLALK